MVGSDPTCTHIAAEQLFVVEKFHLSSALKQFINYVQNICVCTPTQQLCLHHVRLMWHGNVVVDIGAGNCVDCSLVVVPLARSFFIISTHLVKMQRQTKYNKKKWKTDDFRLPTSPAFWLCQCQKST